MGSPGGVSLMLPIAHYRVPILRLGAAGGLTAHAAPSSAQLMVWVAALPDSGPPDQLRRHREPLGSLCVGCLGFEPRTRGLKVRCSAR